MVLTQSCDLFRRDGRCKAPYLTLSVVRTVEDAIRHEIVALEANNPGTLCDHVFISDRLRPRLQLTVTSLLNNNLDGYFFLRADTEAHIDGDWCAFLRVTIPLRVEHYDALLEAKRSQLTSVFQAKVGWLTGSHYARVATPDWDQSGADRKAQTDLIRAFLFDAHQWLPEKQFQVIRQRIDAGALAEAEDAVNAISRDPATKPKTRRALVLAAVDKAWPGGSDDALKRKFIGRFQQLSEFAEAVRE